MDIKNLSAEEIRAARKRLASRKSFFGGSLSTRAEATAPSYNSETKPVPKASSQAHAKPKPAAGHTPKPAAKRPRDTSDDFASLDDNDFPPTKPSSAGQACKAGDVWGQYMAAQARKRNAQQASGARAKQAKVARQRPLLPTKAAAAKPSSHAKSITSSRIHPAGGRQQAARYDEADDDLADFIDDDLAGEDWRSELKAVTGYDPANPARQAHATLKEYSQVEHVCWFWVEPVRDNRRMVASKVKTQFEPVRDDRRMVASKVDIEREERQSKRIGRLEDEKAEEEERRLRALKEAKREKHRSKSKGQKGLMLLD